MGANTNDSKGKEGRWRIFTVLTAMAALLALVGSGAAAAAPATGGDLQAPPGWVDYESQPLRVQVWQEKGQDDVYRRGENIRVHFETNHDAYAVVYRIDADGLVTILWPQNRYDDGFVFGNHEYRLPISGGPPLQAGDRDGVEYLEAVVSAYPFDLRQLAVDFHHEQGMERYDFRIAGDPFLAMNEVNYAVTGLEDPADYVVTDYDSYYIHRAVDHPRYLCQQCHDTGTAYDPYADHCTIEIHYDYGWVNRWQVRFGYWPAYYYPVYYYVDPWTWRPWVNYWYTPWYLWPGGLVYTWPYNYYCWYDSPYYRGDVWVRYKGGNRRWAPLAKDYVTRGKDRESLLRRRSLMVKGDQPGSELREAMRTRTKLSERGAAAVKSPARVAAATSEQRTRYRDVQQAERARTAFKETGRVEQRPGLRLRDEGRRLEPGRRASADQRTTIANPDRRTPARTAAPSAAGQRDLQDRRARPDKSLSGPPRKAEPQRAPGSKAPQAIRPVEPRSPGSRIWSGGRTSPGRNERVKPGEPSTAPARQQPRARPQPAPRRQTQPAARPERHRSSEPQQRSGSSSSSRYEGRNQGGSQSSRASAPRRSAPTMRSGSSRSSAGSSGRSAGSSRSSSRGSRGSRGGGGR
jgi:hypothetical protein